MGKTLKQCTKCHKEKELSEFYKDKGQKTGLRPDCKICKDKLSKEYRIKNLEKIQLINKCYYNTNKIKIKKYYQIYSQTYYIKNKKRIIQHTISSHNQRLRNNLPYKILTNCRIRITQAVRGKNKSLSTMFLIGCEIDYLMYHLQCQFTKDMTWDNYGRGKGKWNIDHIKPCARFDLSKESEQRVCFHYSNLQPLWAEENQSKSDSY